MVHLFRIFLFAFITLLITTCNSNSEIEKHDNTKVEYKKMLMIGNSFTFYWNLPQVLEKMFEASEINIKVFRKQLEEVNSMNIGHITWKKIMILKIMIS